MTLDAALNERGPRVAAWDVSEGSNVLSVVAVGRDRASVIARETVPRAQRSAIERKLDLFGIPIGSTYRECGIVWLCSDEHLAVVQIGVGIRLEALRSDLVIAGRRVRLKEVEAILSFVDRADPGHRGVRVVLKGGDAVTFVEERDAPAGSDAAWITLLGRDLAMQLGIVHRDELAGGESVPVRRRRGDAETDALIDGLIDAWDRWDDPDRVAAREARRAAAEKRDAAILDLAYIESGQRGDAPMDVALAKMAAHFAGRIEREVPDVGTFAEVRQPLPEIENGGYVALDLKPDASGVRVLELLVESPSGANSATEVLRTGSTADLVRYLRGAGFPDHVLPIMQRLTDDTRDD